MAEGKIAVEFSSDIVTARALARAVYAMVCAVETSSASVVVDGFSMNPSDGWSGDFSITIVPRT